MPNRIKRDGILTSPAFNSLQSEMEEAMFDRMLVAADDAGRMDGRPGMLLTTLWPTHPDRYTTQRVEQAVEALIRANLVVRWTHEGRTVLQVLKWQKTCARQYSKFPDANGNFLIEFTERETPDGVRSFVRTSIPGEVVNDTVTGQGYLLDVRPPPSVPPPPKTRAEKSLGFTPPTLEEWLELARTKYSDWPTADASDAHNHYQITHWKYGKARTQITDWPRAMQSCHSLWRKSTATRRGYEPPKDRERMRETKAFNG